jgi:hypothetical protein
MSTDPASAATLEFSAWNPGLRSDLPWSLVPLATMFRPENAFGGVDPRELSDVAGLDVDDPRVFRPGGWWCTSC